MRKEEKEKRKKKEEKEKEKERRKKKKKKRVCRATVCFAVCSKKEEKEEVMKVNLVTFAFRIGTKK